MEWFIAALAVAVIGVAAVAATGRLGELPDVVDDRVAPEMPDGALSSADVRDVEFAVVPRGYSMEQVDALLARVADQIGQPASVPEQPGQPASVPEQPGQPASVPEPETITRSRGGEPGIMDPVQPPQER